METTTLHTDSEVLVPKDEQLMGKMVEVDVIETGKHFLKGQLVKDNHPERPATVPPPLKPGQVSGIPENVLQRSSSISENTDRHPVWVQMAVVVLVLALLVRVTIFVFSDR